MGRAKVTMELIQKEKPRATTFKKRKDGLLRKIHEFTTLCGVEACMIIYGPKNAQPEFWPSDADKVRETLGVYKAKSKESGSKTCGISEFFHDRKRKIEDELAKIRRRNREDKFPSWLDFMNDLEEHQLREFGLELAGKAEDIRSRIHFLQSARGGGEDGGCGNQDWASGSAFDLVLASSMGLGMGIGLDVNRLGQPSHLNFNPAGRGNEWSFLNPQAAAMIAYQPSVSGIEQYHPYHHHIHHQQPQQEFDHQINAMVPWHYENGNEFMAGPSTTGNVHNALEAIPHTLKFNYEAPAPPPAGSGVVDNQVLSSWYYEAPAPVQQYAMHRVQQFPAIEYPAKGENDGEAGE